MVNLNKTRWGVNYLYDYIPPKKWNIYNNSESIEMSKQVWEYKDFDEDAIDFFTEMLMRAITHLSKYEMPSYVKNLALVPIPPSKVNKDSPMKISISIIKDWYEDGITESKFGCTKNIFSYSNLLSRVSDVNTAHKEFPRPTFDEHLESIECSKDNLSRDYMTFILLDDVTTTGITMNACKRILLNHGAVERFIYKLAISGTVGEDYD